MTDHEVASMLCNLSQLLNAVEEDWKLAGHWSDWDAQTVRDFLTYKGRLLAEIERRATGVPVCGPAAVVEAIASQWDRCMAPMFDPAGNPTDPLDIGAAIRAEGVPPGVTPEKGVSGAEVCKVALDIARWFVNGDRPDEFKLKEWAERLDRNAIAAAYEERAEGK